MITRHAAWGGLCFFVCCLGLVGCGSLSDTEKPDAFPFRESAGQPATDGANEPPIAVLPEPEARAIRPDPPRDRTSVEGRLLEYSTHGYGAETVMILGGIHGNEPAGTLLVERLAPYLDVNPFLIQNKRVILAPALNTYGLAGNQRTNANGIDLNRNFATANRKPRKLHGRQPLSEPESVFIVDLIACYRPMRILTLHQPLACVDWDGPGRDLARALSETSGLPLKKLGSLPGSLGSYAGVELGIPIITLELPRGVERWEGEVLWEKYGETLLRFIQFDSDEGVLE
ncbi:MAG: DUF2817 domain-containing protein [Planctomycetota bacterium]